MDVSLPNAIKDPDNILNKTGRKRLSIVGDGNCLFRCFAFLAHGSENAHAKMRSLLVTFVSLNASSFSALVFEGNIKTHVSKMKRFGEWGTQVELQAAATLFQKPLYVLTQSTNDKGDYDWIIYKPQFSNDISFPKETEINFLSTFNAILQHLEICHTNGCHYDCVVDDNSQIPLQPPDLPKRDICVKEIL